MYGCAPFAIMVIFEQGMIKCPWTFHQNFICYLPAIDRKSVEPGAPVLFPEADEIVDCAIIGSFCMDREIAGRQLSAPAVVLKAVTANSMLVTWIAAIAIFIVAFFFTFHVGIFLIIQSFQFQFGKIKIRIRYVNLEFRYFPRFINEKFNGTLRHTRKIPEIDKESIF